MTSLRMPQGFLLVISAPSGAGKSTVCRRLSARDRRVFQSVSATTRRPRPGEREGEHYRFLSKPEFRRWVRGGRLLEWARVHGNHYGTPRAPVERGIRQGRTAALAIDVQGAASVRRRLKGRVVTVFLLPPSWAVLRRRLCGRNEPAASRRLRLANARDEMRRAGSYDYWVVNDDLKTAVRQIEAIVQAKRLRVHRAPASTRAILGPSRRRRPTGGA